MQQQVVAAQAGGPADRERTTDQGAGSRNPAPRERAHRNCAEQSEIERQRIENIAAAERAAADHRGRRSCRRHSQRRRGCGGCHSRSGAAEASIIFQKGEAEAKAMNKPRPTRGGPRQRSSTASSATWPRSCAPWRSRSPGSTRSRSISAGGDDNIGAHKLTGEMTKIASQVPALSKRSPA